MWESSRQPVCSAQAAGLSAATPTMACRQPWGSSAAPLAPASTPATHGRPPPTHCIDRCTSQAPHARRGAQAHPLPQRRQASARRQVVVLVRLRVGQQHQVVHCGRLGGVLQGGGGGVRKAGQKGNLNESQQLRQHRGVDGGGLGGVLQRRQAGRARSRWRGAQAGKGGIRSSDGPGPLGGALIAEPPLPAAAARTRPCARAPTAQSRPRLTQRVRARWPTDRVMPLSLVGGCGARAE